MVEFDTPEELITACERAYAEGFRRMDAYAPMPVEGLAEAIGYKRNKVAFCVLIGGICGVLWRFRPARMDHGRSLPAQCRRPTAEQLAGLHSDYLRVHDSVLRADGDGQHVRDERLPQPVSLRFSTCQLLKEPRSTNFFFVSSRPIRSSAPIDTLEFLRTTRGKRGDACSGIKRQLC